MLHDSFERKGRCEKHQNFMLLLEGKKRWVTNPELAVLTVLWNNPVFCIQTRLLPRLQKNKTLNPYMIYL